MYDIPFGVTGEDIPALTGGITIHCETLVDIGVVIINKSVLEGL